RFDPRFRTRLSLQVHNTNSATIRDLHSEAPSPWLRRTIMHCIVCPDDGELIIRSNEFPPIRCTTFLQTDDGDSTPRLKHSRPLRGLRYHHSDILELKFRRPRFGSLRTFDQLEPLSTFIPFRDSSRSSKAA